MAWIVIRILSNCTLFCLFLLLSPYMVGDGEALVAIPPLSPISPYHSSSSARHCRYWKRQKTHYTYLYARNIAPGLHKLCPVSRPTVQSCIFFSAAAERLQICRMPGAWCKFSDENPTTICWNACKSTHAGDMRIFVISNAHNQQQPAVYSLWPIPTTNPPTCRKRDAEHEYTKRLS